MKLRTAAPLVHVERRDDGVAVVRLDNPKVNALSTALLGQLEAAAKALTDDPPGAVVVTGGERIFAAGRRHHRVRRAPSEARRGRPGLPRGARRRRPPSPGS